MYFLSCNRGMAIARAFSDVRPRNLSSLSNNQSLSSDFLLLHLIFLTICLGRCIVQSLGDEECRFSSWSATIAQPQGRTLYPSRSLTLEYALEALSKTMRQLARSSVVRNFWPAGNSANTLEKHTMRFTSTRAERALISSLLHLRLSPFTYPSVL